MNRVSPRTTVSSRSHHKAPETALDASGKRRLSSEIAADAHRGEIANRPSSDFVPPRPSLDPPTPTQKSSKSSAKISNSNAKISEANEKTPKTSRPVQSEADDKNDAVGFAKSYCDAEQRVNERKAQERAAQQRKEELEQEKEKRLLELTEKGEMYSRVAARRVNSNIKSIKEAENMESLPVAWKKDPFQQRPYLNPDELRKEAKKYGAKVRIRNQGKSSKEAISQATYYNGGDYGYDDAQPLDGLTIEENHITAFNGHLVDAADIPKPQDAAHELLRRIEKLEELRRKVKQSPDKDALNFSFVSDDANKESFDSVEYLQLLLRYKSAMQVCYGPADPIMLRVYIKLAEGQLSCQSYQQALESSTKAVTLENHPVKGTKLLLPKSLNLQGQAFVGLERYREASSAFVKAIRFNKLLKPEGHPSFLSLYRHYGTMLSKIGKHEKAYSLMKMVESMDKPGDQSSRAEYIVHLAESTHALGYNEEAVDYYEEILITAEKDPLMDRNYVMRILETLVDLEERIGRLDKAVRAQSRVALLRSEIYGAAHVKSWTALKYLCLLQVDQNDCPAALATLNRLLDNIEKRKKTRMAKRLLAKATGAAIAPNTRKEETLLASWKGEVFRLQAACYFKLRQWNECRKCLSLIIESEGSGNHGKSYTVESLVSRLSSIESADAQGKLEWSPETLGHTPLRI